MSNSFYTEALKCPYVKNVCEKCPFLRTQVNACPFLSAIKEELANKSQSSHHSQGQSGESFEETKCQCPCGGECCRRCQCHCENKSSSKSESKNENNESNDDRLFPLTQTVDQNGLLVPSMSDFDSHARVPCKGPDKFD